MSLSCLTQMGFSYDIVRSKRKSAAIHVRAGKVEVRIPHFVADQWAIEFLHSKQAWVNNKLAEQAKSQQLRPTLAQGEPLLWLGEPCVLSLNVGPRGVTLKEGTLIVGAQDAETMQPALERFFKLQASAYMVPRTKALAKQYGLEHKLTQVKFRRTKTKWGHCTSKGDIQYNWLIMGAPVGVIDYLICHEVCHLQHPNHSQAFWQLVARHCPDYKQQQAWLKQNSIRLSWC
ncbi:M48 family metallopeptidase [Pseudomonas sp. HK3]